MFPDLQLVPDTLQGGGRTLPNVAEATGVPLAGNNTFLLPFIDDDMNPALVVPGRMKIYYDPDPSRAAGGTANPGVSDVRFVSLSADKRSLTLEFTQTGVGDCFLSVEINHTILGHGASQPVIVGSGSGGGSGGGGGAFSAMLIPLFTLIQEIGSQLISPTFNASYSSPSTSASLADDDGNPAQNVQGLGNPLTMPFTYQETVVGTTRQWTLTADDGGVPDADVAVATWFPGVYYGVDANPGLGTEADIEGLSNKNLQGDKALSTTLAPVLQYIYYAFPTTFPANVLDFQFGAFPGGFIQTVASVNVTANTPGAPVLTYQLWRSQFQQDTTVTGAQPFIVQA